MTSPALLLITAAAYLVAGLALARWAMRRAEGRRACVWWEIRSGD